MRESGEDVKFKITTHPATGTNCFNDSGVGGTGQKKETSSKEGEGQWAASLFQRQAAEQRTT